MRGQPAQALQLRRQPTLGISAIIPGDNATRVGVWKDVGTSDVQIFALSTNTGTGVGIITVTYVQARDLT